MKLDRNISKEPGRCKYALIKLRGIVLSVPEIRAAVNAAVSGATNPRDVVDFGDTPETEFFVIRLKDIYAEPALRAYAEAAFKLGDIEYAGEVRALAQKAKEMRRSGSAKLPGRELGEEHASVIAQVQNSVDFILNGTRPEVLRELSAAGLSLPAILKTCDRTRDGKAEPRPGGPQSMETNATGLWVADDKPAKPDPDYWRREWKLAALNYPELNVISDYVAQAGIEKPETFRTLMRAVQALAREKQAQKADIAVLAAARDTLERRVLNLESELRGAKAQVRGKVEDMCGMELTHQAREMERLRNELKDEQAKNGAQAKAIREMTAARLRPEAEALQVVRSINLGGVWINPEYAGQFYQLTEGTMYDRAAWPTWVQNGLPPCEAVTGGIRLPRTVNSVAGVARAGDWLVELSGGMVCCVQNELAQKTWPDVRPER